MAVPFAGGCACGAIRYECTAEPLYMGNCHCRDCQRATGSAYFPAVGMAATAFRLMTGAPEVYEKLADSGHTMRRMFCVQCGSPVFLTNSARSNLVVLYAGSVDDPSWVRPTRDIYTASAQPWDHLDPTLPKFPQMPPR
ncbi:MAG: GFA family protein [Deltaproteobacteria bacterium]|nr:GFA family protein [Deltaproteobacteria bacterium]